jgi:hypothetical protein
LVGLLSRSLVLFPAIIAALVPPPWVCSSADIFSRRPSSRKSPRMLPIVLLSLVSVSMFKVVVGASLPSCNGCYSSQNGIAYMCCENLSIINGVCTCDGGQCTQCSRSTKDKEKVLPLSPFKKPSVPLAPLSSLPSCNGCYQGFDNVYYACCDNQVIDNGVCTCSNGPCTQCSPSVNDKQKVQTLIKATSKPMNLPPCSCGDISIGNADYTCCGSMSLNNNVCSCNGGPCTQCAPSEPFKPMILDSCSCSTMQLGKTYYSCCGSMAMTNNVCTCDGSPCTPCSPSNNKVVA